jgi:hypothetical protein
MDDQNTDRAIQGGAAAPLSNEQKKRAVMLARRAFDLMLARRAIANGVSFDDWRRRECMQCVERGGLTFAAQSDWPFIMGHFHKLIATHTDNDQERFVSNDVAFKMGAKALNQDASFAMAKLRHECTSAQGVMRDPRGFCRGISLKRFHVEPVQNGLIKLSAQQIWWLIFTLRRRVGQLKRKGRAA